MDIWTKWEKHHESMGLKPHWICKDGIIKPSEYKKTSPKILYAMKEVNGWRGGDLALAFNELWGGPKHQIWHTVARWTAGILSGFPPFKSINHWDAYWDSVFKMAVVNLKKQSGSSSSDMTEINAFTKLDRELLLEQIQGINSNIIIACGTYDQLLWLLDLQINPKRIGDPVWSKRYRAHVVPFRHPARVGSNEKAYAQLRKLVKPLL